MAKASNADRLRSAIDSARAEGKDLKLASERRRIVDTVAASDKSLKPASLQAALSDLLKKDAKAKGEDPADFAKRKPAQYGSALRSSKAPGPVETKSADAQAGAPPPGQPGTVGRVGAPAGGPPGAQPIPTPISASQLGDAIGGLWEGIRMIDSNIESLSKDEKDSLGAIWLPFADVLFAERNRLLALAIVSTVGLTARKVKAGRAITKRQKQEREAAERAKAQAAAAAGEMPQQAQVQGTAQVYRAAPDEAQLAMPPGVQRFDARGKVG